MVRLCSIYISVYNKTMNTYADRKNPRRPSVPFAPPSRLYRAWLSGFWEGEGSIGLTMGGSLHLNLAQKDEGVLNEIAVRTDGKVYCQKSSSSYRVYWYGTRARAVLKMIIPYIRSDYRKQQITRYCPDLAPTIWACSKIVY